MTAEGPGPIGYDDLFVGKRVALFSVPVHLPNLLFAALTRFIEKASELTSKGIDTIACMAVNDVFVMDAW